MNERGLILVIRSDHRHSIGYYYYSNSVVHNDLHWFLLNEDLYPMNDHFALAFVESLDH